MDNNFTQITINSICNSKASIKMHENSIDDFKVGDIVETTILYGFMEISHIDKECGVIYFYEIDESGEMFYLHPKYIIKSTATKETVRMLYGPKNT